MKLNILLSLLFLFSVKSISQTKSTVIIVDGVCMMCENRIEKKAIHLILVRHGQSDWNLENRTLKLVYNEKHISVDEIHKFFASIGHDTKKEIASDDAYSLLDPCCKYRDLQVIRDHGLDREPINHSNKKE